MPVDWSSVFENLASRKFTKHCIDAEQQRNKLISHLLQHGKLPEKGWNESTITYFIDRMACLDTNNYIDNIGMGEREGRVYSHIIKSRHFRMTHGIGRSGNLYELQPKAMGSSIIYRLCNKLVCHAVNLCGIKSITKCIVVPVATGMAISLCLMTLRHIKPKAKYVIWLRVDQKSCFKCILTAGYTPEIIETIVNGNYLETNLLEMESRINSLGSENILCVISTTSCFAPRLPDKIEDISHICYKNKLYHIINNAYGLQSSNISHQINQAILHQQSEVTYVVQSTDKNFMVPVGGSIIYSKDNLYLEKFSKNYPGRASLSPIFDICITLLEMGQNNLLKLLNERKQSYTYMMDKLIELEAKYGNYFKVLANPKNGISIVLTLSTFSNNNRQNNGLLWKIGEKLYYKHISGSRVVVSGKDQQIDIYKFINWGQHNNTYPYSEYITFAVSLGLTIEHIDTFMEKLDKIIKKCY